MLYLLLLEAKEGIFGTNGWHDYGVSKVIPKSVGVISSTASFHENVVMVENLDCSALVSGKKCV